MMNREPDYVNKAELISSYSDAMGIEETEKILTQKRTKYTKAVNQIIQKVQQEFLENLRVTEIDKALDSKDKNRFIALTSEGWENKL